ncbi:MAG TPA: UDP-N-acetylglucosamine 2-epimerase (non-hydrolyzing) [Phycisphaerales bacterium]|nr:UDP-N-acetylglucosamine 2-epimerase (non-hydrolyzing) [Phycisphaerales bacterium]|tara:strand:+ start:834 stop:1979 length:1146 start_codon:yes stop_codon:yes gene_type:complete
MPRVAVIIGTRPEGIKMAAVCRALQDAPDMDPVLVSTGQHREMLAQVLDVFGLEADVELDLMRGNQSLAGLTARLFEALDGMLETVKPDMVLVQGDTTSVMCGAIASFYRGIPVGHVEAGLRTGDLSAPFPEEANRVLASRVTTLHFAPTEGSRRNLLDELVPEERIQVTGNTVIDSLFLEVDRQRNDQTLKSDIDDRLGEMLPEDIIRRDRPYVLITGHRRENFGDGFESICTALLNLARRFPDHGFVYPVHLNPNVRGIVHDRLSDQTNIHLLPPVDYRLFVALMSGSRLLLTDSGGVQEEAPSLGKPVLVMRETTERPEGVAAGTVRLVGTDAGLIEEEVARLLEDPSAYAAMAHLENPYGDGRAADRIVDGIRGWFG